MSGSIFLSASALCYIILIMWVFFSKEKINTTENKLFTKLIIVSFFALLAELYIPLLPKDMNFLPFVIALKLYLILLIFWLSYFMEYVFIITRNNKKKEKIAYKEKYRKLYVGFWIFVVILAIAVCILPIYFFDENGMKYSYGPSVNVLFALSGIYTTIMLIYLIKNFKKLKNKGYIPIIFFVLLMGLTVVFQNINPSFLIANACFAFITALMYHTIENPDLKMVEELNKNRELIERNNQEKSNLLFKISQEVRQPINEIELLSNNLNTKDETSLKINMEAKRLRLLVDKALDISQLDVSNLKIYNNTYDIYTLFDEIIMLMKNKITNDVEFRNSVSKNLPPVLYGDSVKLKQVICSIISNSINNTTEGMIELEVSSIVKYDVCRLVININDTSKGINLSTINDILESKDKLTEKDLADLNEINVNLKVCQKIVNLLGGTLLIKSELNQGSSITIIIDQKIKQAKKTNQKVVSNKKKILIVDDNYSELEEISNILKNSNYQVVTTMYGEDCISKYKASERYDLILIADDMEKKSATDTIKELKKLKGFKSNVVVMLDPKKDKVKENYIEDYQFTDYLMKDNLEKELQRITEKWL